MVIPRGFILNCCEFVISLFCLGKTKKQARNLRIEEKKRTREVIILASS